MSQFPKQITVTPEVWRAYKQTIARHDPETVAIIGGDLARPGRITEFRFCPPRKSANGRYDVSRSHINLDADLLNFVVDQEWKPNGLYMAGCWHSHPNGSSRPSVGDASRNEGDIAFFTNCLEHDDSPDRNWNCFIAPITTFDASGSDQVNGWILERGNSTPRSVPVIVETRELVETVSALDLTPARAALARSAAHATLARELLGCHAAEMSAVRTDASLSDADRETMLRELDNLRATDAKDLLLRRHPVSLALGLGDERLPQEPQAVQHSAATPAALPRQPWPSGDRDDFFSHKFSPPAP